MRLQRGRVAPLALLLLCSSYVLCTYAISLDDVEDLASDIDAELTDLAQGMYYNELFLIFNDARSQTVNKQLNDDVDDMRDIMEEFFSNMTTAAERLADIAEDNYGASGSSDFRWNAPFEDGQELPGPLEYSYAFKDFVDIEGGAGRVPQEVANGEQEVLDNSINFLKWAADMDEYFIEEMELNPAIRWQYIGSTDGAQYSYPGKEWTRSYAGFYADFDPRYRPWYIQATSGPKDVVVVLDTSSSMSGVQFSGAQAGARAIIDSLSSDDYVGFVSMGYWSAFEGPCFGVNMGRATPSVQRLIKSTIDYEYPYGPTVYEAGIGLANQMLENGEATGNTANCEKFVVVFTDGLDADYGEYEGCGGGCDDNGNCDPPCPSDNILKGGGLTGYTDLKVTYFIFVFGDLKYDLDIPRYIACYSCDKGQCGQIYDIKPTKENGFYQPFTNMRTRVRPFFDYLAAATAQSETSVTSPYVDSGGRIGLVITFARPLFDSSDKVFGVLGIDASLEQIEYMLRDKAWGNAYWFLINSQGETLVHPRLKTSSEYTENPDFVDILYLETRKDEDGDHYPAEFVQMREDMLDGNDGSETFATFRAVPRGDAAFDGETFVAVTNTYVYRQVPGTDMIVCLVAGSTDISYDEITGELAEYAPDPYSYYHRLDIIEESPELATMAAALDIGVYKGYEQAYTSQTESTVKFAARAFCNPVAYLEEPIETWEDVELITDAMNNWTFVSNNTGECKQYGPGDDVAPGDRILSHEAVNGVRVTSAIDTYWANDDTEDVVWRYVATVAGVHRRFPGGASSRNYDPARRPWYNRALTYPGEDTVSTPYVDASGAGKVVTLSKTIAPGGKVEAVVGIDRTYKEFAKSIDAITSGKCGGSTVCMLVDRSGFVVHHPDFEKDTGLCKFKHKWHCQARPHCEWHQDVLKPQDDTAGDCMDAFSRVSLGALEGDLARVLYYQLDVLQKSEWPEYAGFCPAGWQDDPDYVAVVSKEWLQHSDADDQGSGDSSIGSSTSSRGVGGHMSSRDKLRLMKEAIKEKHVDDANSEWMDMLDFDLESESHEGADDHPFIASPASPTARTLSQKDIIPVEDPILDDWRIQPSPQKHECLKVRRSFTFDHAEVLEGGKNVKGTYYGPCSSGDYYVAPVGDTNLYLIAIDNKVTNPAAFECAWVNNLVISEADPVPSECATGFGSEDKTPDPCPVTYKDVPLNCNAAVSVGINMWVVAVAVVFVVCGLW